MGRLLLTCAMTLLLAGCGPGDIAAIDIPADDPGDPFFSGDDILPDAGSGGELDSGETHDPDAAASDDAGSGTGDAGRGDASGDGADGGSRDASRPDSGTGADAGTPPQPYSFVVFGDNQFATFSCTSGVPERLAVPKAIAAERPTFLLHVGDLMDHGYEAGAYAQFQSCYDAMLDAFPFFSTAGNHDMGSAAIVAYKSFLESRLVTRNRQVYGAGWASDFQVTYGDDPTNYSTNPSAPANKPDLPSGFSFKTFYAFRFRNSYVISFESGTQWWTNTPISWVTKHLTRAKNDPSIDHVFVLLHHPLYSTTMPDDNATNDSLLPVRKIYESLFRQYNVTAVFAGHVHLYEHFYVPDDNHATRGGGPSYPHDGRGVQYVVTGGAGGPLPNNCAPMPADRGESSTSFLQKRNCGYHYTHVSVAGGKLTFKVVRVYGSSTSFSKTTWDTFTVD